MATAEAPHPNTEVSHKTPDAHDGTPDSGHESRAHLSESANLADPKNREIFQTSSSINTAADHLNTCQFEPNGSINFAPPGQGGVEHCDITATTAAAAAPGDTQATPAAANGSSDAFIQQLNTTDPNLAKELTDAQGQMTPAGASQLETNVATNFNSGQYAMDSTLLNNSLTGLSSTDATAAQGSFNADLANSNTGDAPTSNYAFMQGLQTTDPILAQQLTDAQAQMTPAGAALLEANAQANFNNNNSQFPTDSSLLNGSLNGLSPADTAAAQTSFTNDINNLGDAAVSTFNGQKNPGDANTAANSAPSSDASTAAACPPGDSGTSQAGADPLAALQTDLTNIMQDISNGDLSKLGQDLPQFIQDLVAEMTSLSGNSSQSQPPSDASAAPLDGSAPSSPTVAANPAQPGGDATTTTTVAANPGTTSNALGAPNIVNDGSASASDLQQVQNAFATGPASLMNAMQGTQVNLTGADIGSAGYFDSTTGQITLSSNPNDTPSGYLQEAAVHEDVHNWDAKTGFSSSQPFLTAANTDLNSLPAGALNNLPVALADGPSMNSANNGQVNMGDVVAEIGTYIAAQDTRNNAVDISGAGAMLAQLFPNVYSVEKQAIG